ncbi:MAG: ABC transporter substrate-binding protein [Propionibacterium sp.]|nr:ABC transporter substrate-binding protein [Propionibacterium sp.]
MSRPSTEAEYLASLTPASARFSRRTLLRGALGSGAAIAGVSSLAACGSSNSSSGTGGTASATGTVTLGSNQSDQVPKDALAKVVSDFQAENSGLTVNINTVDHNTFQNNINTYLQGNPDDVFTWFAGYRMRFFASKGLAGDISDVWKNLNGMTDALKKSSTGDDGKQYFIPSTYYPWAVHYRKSVWDKYGYTVPTTMSEFTALCDQMKKDGLTPIAFADKDGWPAMGTFDIINMRVNGYDFHISLMAGKEDWTGSKVKSVFDTWTSLAKYQQADSLGRTWQESAQSLQQGKAGMYYLGTFVAQQFTAAEQQDLKFFNFPEIDSSVGAGAIDAPIDGYMLAAKPKNEAGAKKLLLYLGGPKAQLVAVTADTSVVATNSQVDTSAYTALQKAEVDFVGKATSIAQFLDRDTRPDFASTVITPALQSYIKNPADISTILTQIEDQKKALFS